MIVRIRYGGRDNPFNYSNFVCDTMNDINDLPTNKKTGENGLETCSIGSKAIVIENREQYILNGNNEWKLLKNYKSQSGGGSNLEIDTTLTKTGYAADAKIVGDEIIALKSIENTVESLVANLADSGWVELDSSCYIYGSALDETTTKIYYRKIGAIVNLCGILKWTEVPVPSTYLQIPEGIHPITSIPIIACGTNNGTIVLLLSEQGYVTAREEIDFSEAIYFNITYMTNDSLIDTSSLLAALADIVEVE